MTKPNQTKTIAYGGRVENVMNVNVCCRCDSEMVGRNAVTALVTGQARAYVPVSMMRRVVYYAGASTYFGMRDVRSGYYRMAGDDIYDEKHIRCACDVKARPELDVYSIVHEQFRDRVRERYGEDFSLYLLFQLPLEVVAWEKAGYFTVDLDTGVLSVTEQGDKLMDVIRELSRRGEFVRSRTVLTMDSIIADASYLRMIKPKYRLAVFADFGSEVSLIELFRKLPMRWFDWEMFHALNACTGSGGYLRIHRDYSVSLLEHSFVQLKNSRPVSARTVPGSSVAENGRWIRFLPTSKVCPVALVGSDAAYRSSCVLLQPGDTYLPTGDVILTGDNMAITFEPGTIVRTAAGAVLNTLDGALSIFLSGSVCLQLHLRDCREPGPHCDCHAEHPGATDYSVAATVDSFNEHTTLGEWFQAKYDPTGTMATFWKRDVEFVVFSPAHFPVDKFCYTLAVHTTTLSDDGVARVEHCVLGKSSDVWCPLMRGSCIFRAANFAVEDLIIDGIRLSSTTKIGFNHPQLLTGGALPDYGMVEGDDDIPRILCHVDSMVDGNTEVSDGGSVMSDVSLDVRDVTTHVWMNAIAYLRHHVGDSDPPGYLVLANHQESMAYHCGVLPTLEELMMCPAYFVDVDKLSFIGYYVSQTGVFFGMRDKHKFSSTMRDLYNYARTWKHSYRARARIERTFYDLLVELYGTDECECVPALFNHCF